MLFQNRNADLLGTSGVDRGFVNHHRPGLHRLADRFAGLDQRRQIRAIGLVDRRRHRDDENTAIRDILQAVAVGKLLRSNQILRRDLQRAVLAGLQFGNARQIDVEAHHRPRLAEFDRQRQTNIAQADDRNFLVIQIHINPFVIL